MSTKKSSTVIDPETYRASLEMPIKLWWLVEVALSNASRELHGEAMGALVEGDIPASDVWHRMAVDNDAAHFAVLAIVNAYPIPDKC